MTIQTERPKKSTLILSLEGRLDTATAPLLERKIKQWGDEVRELILDFAGLTYISSMGLRVLLQTQKALLEQSRRLIVRNMPDPIREVFKMTGFINLLVQEEKFVVIRKDGEANRVTLSLIGKMACENIPVLTKELGQIREEYLQQEEEVEVVLDVQKLTDLPSACCKLLKEAIDGSAWERRKLVMENAIGKIENVVRDAGLGSALSGEPRTSAGNAAV